MTNTKQSNQRPRVALATLGCKLNQAESQDLADRFRQSGYQLADFDHVADVYIINTCSVTHIADRKSRQLIRQARRANPAGLVVVTGCYAEVSPEDVAQTERIDLVVSNQDKAHIVDLVTALVDANRFPQASDVELNLPTSGDELTSRTRVMLKIQEGCDKFCSYCIVPHARGRERGRPIAEIIQDVRVLVEQGRKEIVLTGVNIGAYRQDSTERGRSDLPELVHAIVEQTTLPRLRLSSIEPEDFDERLLAFFHSGRVARHVHLPLQSGSDTILKAMRRRYDSASFLRLVEKIRAAVPDVAITTDIIVGFPGEGETEFQETLEVVRTARFAAAHVFKYSSRRGTPASQMSNQVPYALKQSRSQILARLADEIGQQYRDHFIGHTLNVLYEQIAQIPVPAGTETGGMVWEGLTDNYLRVFAVCENSLVNQILTTRLISGHSGGLWGAIIDDGC
jgi:threonylcarbamoyladenosine tRNA methylthiotransferase MtaB